MCLGKGKGILNIVKKECYMFLFTYGYIWIHEYNDFMLFIFFIVFPDLVDAIPASLHVSVIIFCAVLILFSSVCCAFFMYNAFGNPYETLHGPLGLYLWNLISCESSEWLNLSVIALCPFCQPLPAQRHKHTHTDTSLKGLFWNSSVWIWATIIYFSIPQNMFCVPFREGWDWLA